MSPMLMTLLTQNHGTITLVLKFLYLVVEPNELENLYSMQGIMMVSSLEINTINQFLIFPPTKLNFQMGKLENTVLTSLYKTCFHKCNPDGNQFLLMEAIVDHNVTDEALLRPGEIHVTINSCQCQKKTTKGWHICVEWCVSRIDLVGKTLITEGVIPCGTSRVCCCQGNQTLACFCWWVPRVLRKHDCIIATVNKRYHKKSQKFGFKVPKTVNHAIEIN